MHNIYKQYFYILSAPTHFYASASSSGIYGIAFITLMIFITLAKCNDKAP
jgi:apolipoprotein N-acyltransferase